MSPYLDHNATSPLRPEARARWLEVLEGAAGNPSSLHESGRRARHAIDEAREQVAAALGVHEDEVVFTSGGTEADNLALFGTLGARIDAGAAPDQAGLVTTAVEHSAVLEPARVLAKRGHPLAIVPVGPEGTPDPGAVLAAASVPGTALVSIQAANNEIGSTPDLPAIGEGLERLGAARPSLHTDAVQALGRIALELEAWRVDLASISAHKVGGPLGVGVLVRRRNAALRPLLYGGGQEGGLRPGTENAPAIAAAAVAIETAVRERAAFAARAHAWLTALRAQLRERVEGVRFLGPDLDAPRRLPSTLSVLLPGRDGRLLVTRFDREGLALSAGSACASGSLEPSHVLLALGLDAEAARSGLRISLGWNTTEDDCKRAAEILCARDGASRAT